MPINNLPASLQAAIQEGYLEREFHDPLVATLGFRAVADPEPFSANIGETVTKTRDGLLPAITEPMSAAANTDITSGLTDQNYAIEQYILSVNQYAAPKMLNIVTSRVAIADLYLRNAKKLGEQAYRSVDTLARNALFNAYLGGNTRVNTALGAAGTTVSVDDIRGFRKVFNAEGQLVPISADNSITVTVGGTIYECTAATADAVNVSTALVTGGISGTLTFASNVATVDGALNNPVINTVAPQVIRPSPTATPSTQVTTTAAISAANDVNNGRLTVEMILAAKSQMKANGVPPVESSGLYHCYVDPIHMNGLYADPAFQRFFQGKKDSPEYRQGAIAELLGVSVIETNQNPVQALAGVGVVRRAILCGQGALIEGTFTSTAYEEANEHDDGLLTTVVDGIAHITREPLDVLKQVVTQAWSYIGGFTVPTDITTTPATIPTATNAAHKRAVIVESL